MAPARSATKRRLHLWNAVLLGFVLTGCGTMATGGGWGQDATLAPGWNRLGQAALDAVSAPETWVPAVAAAAARIEGDSEHVTCNAYFATLASRNIGTMGWPRGGAIAAQVGLGTLSVAEAWARVEAFQHYPSDVLGSLALGHFLGAFITDAFIGIDNPRNAAVLFKPGKPASTVLVRLDF